ncbi:MAG: YidC/Oxa1 family membrane protein insertase [Mycoplasmatales bacterium]
MRKHYKIILLLVLVVSLTGCGAQVPIEAQANGIWEIFIKFFAEMIIFFSRMLGNNIGWGIIVAAIIFRVAQIPVYKKQMESSEAMSILQPEMAKINKKFEGKESKDDKMKKQQEIAALYQRHNINPLASCLPALIQMPLFFAFYGAIQGLLFYGTAVGQPAGQVAYQGLINLGAEDISRIWLGMDLSLPSMLWGVLAAVTMFGSTKLSMMGTSTDGSQKGMMMMMLYAFPLMFLFLGMTSASALTLYWTVGNLFSILQTLYFKRTHIFNRKQEEKFLNKK